MVKRVREPEKEKSAKKVAFSEETPDVAKEEAEAAQPEIDVIAAKQKRRDVVLEGAETKLGVGTRKAEEGIGGNEKTNADKYQEEMGHMMTGFNTREERQEGDFTDEGTYQLTMKRDPWLFQLDQKQESRGGQVTSEGMFVKNIETKSAKKEDAPIPATTALMNVLRHLEDGETVNNAVKRLGKAHDSKKKAAADSPLTLVINGAAQMVAEGEYSFYTNTKRQVAAFLTEKLEEKYPTTQWNIKWNGKEEVHGPFGISQIYAWYAANYLTAASVSVIGENSEHDWVEGTSFSL